VIAKFGAEGKDKNECEREWGECGVARRGGEMTGKVSAKTKRGGGRWLEEETIARSGFFLSGIESEVDHRVHEVSSMESGRRKMRMPQGVQSATRCIRPFWQRGQ
jgi:hypothetical protein